MPTSAPSVPIDRPSMALLGSEPWRAAMEFVSHKFCRLPAQSPGDGHPVVVFPGLATDGRATAPLRAYCKALGYDAMDWGRGFNTGPEGDLDEWLGQLSAHVKGLLEGHGQPASLVGWSLGGLYARELGKRLGPLVRQVITIGTPFNATADRTHVGWLFKLVSGRAPELDDAWAERLRTPPPVPTVSIYSRSDGVVAWQACVHERTSRLVRNVEVEGSHIGMGWNPAVLQAVAQELAPRRRRASLALA
jgi:pimeloyl-ACP methyl ester carboxylesterase